MRLQESDLEMTRDLTRVSQSDGYERMVFLIELPGSIAGLTAWPPVKMSLIELFYLSPHVAVVWIRT